jgi:uncharacterized protein YtpQ (UPF0354 family)
LEVESKVFSGQAKAVFDPMKRFFQSVFGGDPGILTPAQFTKEFVRALRASSPGLQVEVVQEMELKVQVAGGRPNAMVLNNAYGTYKTDPKSKEDVVKRVVASFLQTMDTGSASESLDPTRIIPVVKDRPWLEERRKALKNQGAEKAAENVYEVLNEDLVILYAEESSKNPRYLSLEDLQKVEVSLKDLRNLACENLKQKIRKIERHQVDGLFMIVAGGGYEASLLLFDVLWEGIKTEVRGDVVVAIPTHYLLVVTGSDDAEGIKKMKKIIKDATVKGSHLLTDKMFVYHGGKFDAFSGT